MRNHKQKNANFTLRMALKGIAGKCSALSLLDDEGQSDWKEVEEGIEKALGQHYKDSA
jgi:hypothetical protein